MLDCPGAERRLEALTYGDRKFSGDEAFLTDPNAFNDKLNTGEPVPSTSAAADASKL